MSNLNIPPFDFLKGQEVPFEGFGDILPDSLTTKNLLQDQIRRAGERVEKGFGLELDDPKKLLVELEKTIDEMWEEGWEPNKGDINLFATDFGLLITKTIRDIFGGKYIFRSENDLTHLSIFWAEKGMEVFPFHKVYKRLIKRSGESLVDFIQGLEQMLDEC